jgi:WD40 repeat protein
LSADGKRLCSGSEDRTIMVWDLEAGWETLTLRGHTNRVTSLALSADGKRLCSGSEDRTIKVWDLIKGQEAHALKGHTADVSSVPISGDGPRIVSGSLDKGAAHFVVARRAPARSDGSAEVSPCAPDGLEVRIGFSVL